MTTTIRQRATDIVTNNKNQVIVREEKLPMFEDINNCNKDIFVVPTQEGADKDDQWNGSIGDATMEHVYNMSHRGPEMEHFYYAPDGNIFRTEANVSQRDDVDAAQKKRLVDGLSIPTGKQLAHDVAGWSNTGVVKRREVTEEDKDALVTFLMEELQEQRDRRESEDALDQGLVAFEDWEDMPQLTKHIDIPSTPTPLYIYAGNCTQMFYDWFPEDHPDKKLINQLLTMLNGIDWDDFQVEQVEYFQNWLSAPEMKSGSGRGLVKFKHFFAEERLKQLMLSIYEHSVIQPEELVQVALRDIEQDYAVYVHHKAIKLAYESPVMKEIQAFEDSLRPRHLAGELIWRDIGAFAKKLFQKYGKDNITPYHWRRYNELKTKFAPQVLVSAKGKVLDLNRANFREISAAFGPEFARWVVTSERKVEKRVLAVGDRKPVRDEKNIARPFFSVEDLIKAGKLTMENIGYTDKNVGFISGMIMNAKKARKTGNIRLVTSFAQQLVDKQKANPGLMSADEWTQVWVAYRVCKEFATNSTIGQ